MKIKLKSKEEIFKLLILIGSIFLFIGLSISWYFPQGAAAILSISGTFLIFLALTGYILISFYKDFKLSKNKKWHYLLIVILLSSFIINLNVTLTTPIVFGDEGFYASRGLWIAENLEIPQYQYIQAQSDAFNIINMRHPGLFLYVAWLFILGGEILVKSFLPFVSLLIGIIIFLLVKKIFSLEAGMLSALFLFTIPSFITYTVLLYAEVLAIFFVITSLLFLYLNKNKTYLIFSGIFAGIAALTEVGSTIFPLIVLLILLVYRENTRRFIKQYIIFLIPFLLIFSSWFLFHNYIPHGKTGLPTIGLKKDVTTIFYKEIPDLIEDHLISPEEVSGGTSLSVLNIGLTNYINFAYTGWIVFFTLIGIFFLILNKNRQSYYVIIPLFIFLIITFLIFGFKGRSEDAARGMLYITPFLAILSGLGIGEIIKELKDYKYLKYIGLIIVIGLLIFSLNSALAKAESLKPIKNFFPSFFEGCEWIKKNTPEDSLLITLWGPRAMYTCKRDTIYGRIYGIGDAILVSDNRTYDIFKLHGADYIYVNKFSIREGKLLESFPLRFVQYIENNPHFYEKVYETTENCLSVQEIDCSIVYKIN